MDGEKDPVSSVALLGAEDDTARKGTDADVKHGAKASQFVTLLANDECFETRALRWTAAFERINMARLEAHPPKNNPGVIRQRGRAQRHAAHGLGTAAGVEMMRLWRGMACANFKVGNERGVRREDEVMICIMTGMSCKWRPAQNQG
jgi:hypothetical protein